MNKIVSLSNIELSRPSSSQVFPATPAQSQGIEEAHQAANRLMNPAQMKYYKALEEIKCRYDKYREEFDTAPTSALLEKLKELAESRCLRDTIHPFFETRYFEFRPQTGHTRAQMAHQLAIMSMGHTHRVTVPFKVTLSQPIPRLEEITGIVRSRRLFGGFDYRIDLSQVSCTVSENGLTVGDQTIPLVMINKARLGWKAMGGDQWTRDNSQASSQELMTSVIARMDQYRRDEEVHPKSQLKKELDEIQADLVKTLTQIGLDFIDAKMPDFKKALSLYKADSFAQFVDWFYASRAKFMQEMTTALTPDSEQISAEIKSALRSEFRYKFDKKAHTSLNGLLPIKFDTVTMDRECPVLVYTTRPFVRDDQSTQMPEHDPQEETVGRWQNEWKKVPADQKEFYRRLGLRW